MTTLRAIPVYKVILQWTRKATGYIGKLYEMTIDPDNKRLYVHDNSTAGGNPVHIHVDNVDELSTVLEDYYTENEIAYLLSGYEPAITKGTTDQYFRGDMSLATFPTSMPPTIHDHDDRYLTDSEIATLLSNYSAINHDHDGVYAPVNDERFGITSYPLELYVDQSMVLAEFSGQSLSQLHIYGNNAIDLSSSSLGELNIFHSETDGYHHLPSGANGGFLRGISPGNYSWDNTKYSEITHGHNYGFLVKLDDVQGFIVTTDGLSGSSMNFVAGESMAIDIAANRTLVFSATNEHEHDDRYFTETEMAGFLDTLQPYIRPCTDAEADNGEIFISTSVTNLRLSFKDMAGVVTRTN